jgi:hypothetical protein
VETRPSTSPDPDGLMDGLVLPSAGTGPLLQRDYWAVIRGCDLSPPEIGDLLAREFARFAPEELVTFERVDGRDDPLQPGDELKVDIRLAGGCRVRVLHRDRNSLTLGTLAGHPEAGRITFGAYRNDDGEVVVHIRSRARSSSGAAFAGFMTAGEPMQTNSWTDFIDRVANSVGEGVVGAIHAETRKIDDEPEDPRTFCSPTFRARGT